MQFTAYAGAAWAAAVQAVLEEGAPAWQRGDTPDAQWQQGDTAATSGPLAVVAPGTPRGMEVAAHLAARLDVAMAANVVGIEETDPLVVTRQVQGDFALLDQRDGDLFMDAGMVTGPADWSLAFDAGMSFKQWHSPVPMAHQMGVFDRALKYLLNLQVGQPMRRLNWTMTINPRLDTSPETYHEWGADRGTVTAQNAGELVHLRVELQVMARLPRSYALMFSIRTYLISMNELATQPHWARRLYRVLRDLPEPIADYKGLSRYRGALLDWLRPFDPQA